MVFLVGGSFALGDTRATRAAPVQRDITVGGYVLDAFDWLWREGAHAPRMMSVGLTKRGEKLLARIMPEHFRRMAWLMAPLSEHDRRTFVRLLTKVLARAAEEPSSAETGNGRARETVSIAAAR